MHTYTELSVLSQQSLVVVYVEQNSLHICTFIHVHKLRAIGYIEVQEELLVASSQFKEIARVQNRVDSLQGDDGSIALGCRTICTEDLSPQASESKT
jgi:hypothetical protein